MKTRNLIFIAILALGVITVSCNMGETKQTTKADEKSSSSISISDVTIDPAASVVAWEGTMLGVYSHSGTLDLNDAEIYFAG